MNRRELLTTAAAGVAAITCGRRLAAAKEFYPTSVNEALFEGINRVKDPAKETGLEMVHSPVITAPEKVKADEAFDVEVAVGKTLHPMGPDHWIEYVQLNVGNQPAGTLMLRSRGYLAPKARFSVKLDESLKGKKVSLVVLIRCNLHGIWQSSATVEVA